MSQEAQELHQLQADLVSQMDPEEGIRFFLNTGDELDFHLILILNNKLIIYNKLLKL